MTTTHVAVYTRSSAYGGPEEGGWSFPTGALVAHAQVRDEFEARRVVATFNTIYDRDNYLFRTLDWDSERDLTEWFDRYGNLIREYPKVRPHYE